MIEADNILTRKTSFLEGKHWFWTICATDCYLINGIKLLYHWLQYTHKLAYIRHSVQLFSVSILPKNWWFDTGWFYQSCTTKSFNNNAMYPGITKIPQLCYTKETRIKGRNTY